MRPDADWQDTGYQPRMQTRGQPVDDQNDGGYPVRAEDAWGDPFEDGAEDPNLRQERSDNLNYHQGEFWETPGAAPKAKTTGEQRPVTGSQPPAGGIRTPQTGSAAPQTGTGAPAKTAARERKRRAAGPKVRKPVSINRRILRRAAAVLAALAWIAVGVAAIVCRVQAVQVEGNTRIASSTVVELSGLKNGYHNIWFVDDDAVIRSVEQNRYLRVVSVEKLFPSTVILHVRERTQSAYICYAGILYVLDSRGVVLEESNDTDAQPALMRLEGLEVANEPILGRRISPRKSEQLDTYVRMMMELKALQMLDRVTEFYVSDANNLYLATSDGYSVRLGTSDRLHAKLRAMMLVRDELRSRGLTDGTIDVATPEQPTYIPESVRTTT